MYPALVLVALSLAFRAPIRRMRKDMGPDGPRGEATYCENWRSKSSRAGENEINTWRPICRPHSTQSATGPRPFIPHVAEKKLSVSEGGSVIKLRGHASAMEVVVRTHDFRPR